MNLPMCQLFFSIYCATETLLCCYFCLSFGDLLQYMCCLSHFVALPKWFFMVPHQMPLFIVALSLSSAFLAILSLFPSLISVNISVGFLHAINFRCVSSYYIIYTFFVPKFHLWCSGTLHVFNLFRGNHRNSDKNQRKRIYFGINRSLNKYLCAHNMSTEWNEKRETKKKRNQR